MNAHNKVMAVVRETHVHYHVCTANIHLWQTKFAKETSHRRRGMNKSQPPTQLTANLR